ncbi:MAG: hypothetical protein SCK29_13110 [Bacillota bacterium]|nr:hypothetical protein [Bacillota bacterium]MDW7685040.1 hypothetical protein [Bacillota bacterium]
MSAKLRKIVLPVILILLLSVFAVSCSQNEPEPGDASPDKPPQEQADVAEPENGEPAEKPGESPEPTEQAEPEIVDNWQNPHDLKTMTRLFAEIKYSWQNSGQPETNLSYRFEGTESVAGTETSKITITIDESGSQEGFTFWVDEQGTIQQMEVDGQIMPAEMASVMADGLFMGFFWPFNLANDFQVGEVLRGRGPGWQVNVTGTEKKNFGTLTADVHSVKVTVTSPAAGESGVVEWQIADFGTFQMLVGWHWETNMEESDFSFQVAEIKLR